MKKKNEISCSRSRTLALRTSCVALRKFFDSQDVFWDQFKISSKNFRTSGKPEKIVCISGLVLQCESVVYLVQAQVVLGVGGDDVWSSLAVEISCLEHSLTGNAVITSSSLLPKSFVGKQVYFCDGSQEGLPVFRSL